MSRAITSKLEINDIELAKQALDTAGVGYQVQGDVIYLTTPPFHHAVLDTRTGVLRGDSDFGHTEDSFGLLRQYYSEQLVRREYAKSGTTIDGRTTTEEGDIVLTWHFAG